MPDQPPVDVSVIIPTYNRLWCLPRAVESCRGTACRTEIIVVDDGSTDGTWEWLQCQPDLIAVRQANQGQTWAVNYGVETSRGSYIRFLDSDDSLAAGAIDNQLAVARATAAQLVYSRVDEWDEAAERVLSRDDLPIWDDMIATQLGEPGAGHFLGMLFDRALVAQVPRRPDFALREDRMFLLEVALLNPRAVRCDGCAGYWHKHDTQMHDAYGNLTLAVAVWQHVRIYRRVLDTLVQQGELTDRRRRAAARVLWGLAHDAARIDIGEAAAVARWAIDLDPSVGNGRGMQDRFYRTLGFERTELLLRLRRTLVAPFGSRRNRHDWYGVTTSEQAPNSARGAAERNTALSPVLEVLRT